MKLYDSSGQLKITGGGGGGGGSVNFSAGTTSNNLSAITFSNLNGVSFGLDGSTITASVAAAGGAQTGISGIQVSDTTYTSGTVTFRNSNGISFGSSGANGITASYTVPTQSNQTGGIYVTAQSTGQSSSSTYDLRTLSIVPDGIISAGWSGGSFRISATQSNQAFSAGAASSTFQTLSFQDSNQISFSNNAGAIRVTHDLMLSTSRPAFSAGAASSTFQTLQFQDSLNLSFSNNAGSVRVSHNLAGTSTGSAANILGISMTLNSSGLNLSLTAPTQTNQTGGIYVTAQSTGQSSSSTYDLRTLSIIPDGIISAGWSAGSFRISATQSNQAFSAAGGSSAFQTLSFGDTNSVSFTNTNGSVGIASIKLQMFAVSNTTQSSSGTANHTALSFGGAGIASVGITGGSVVISVPSGGGAGDGGVFAGVSNLGNTAGSTGTVSTGNFVLVGSNGISLSQSTGAAGSAATVTIYGNAPISSFQNMPALMASSALTFNQTSISQAVAFDMGQDGSFSFLRIPALMTTNSTTIATLASATATASGGLFSTLNAVIYSLGTGANSQSLRSVASGSAGFSMTQQISITNSTQYSISLGISAQANGAGTSRSTQYSISNTNYSFTTNQIATEFSTGRFLDIPFANSLSAGPYWLVIGMSTSTGSGGAAGLAALTNCNVRYSNHYGVSQVNVGFGIMGSTNLTSGGQLGNGFFSTAGGGTTNSIPISAISSTVSNPIPFFAMLRSA